LPASVAVETARRIFAGNTLYVGVAQVATVGLFSAGASALFSGMAERLFIFRIL